MRFRGNPVNTLGQLIRLLEQHPHLRLFLEIKRESVRRLGTDESVGIVLGSIPVSVQPQIVVISFDANVLHTIRAASRLDVGWILDANSHQVLQCLEAMEVQYVFASQNFWDAKGRQAYVGPWQRVVYTINQIDELRRWSTEFDFVETDRFDEFVGFQ
jgi:hypothetical protein